MEDKRPAIGLDLDGVLADFSGEFSRRINEKYGLNSDPTKQTDWDFLCQGVTAEQEAAIWADIDATPNFWLTLNPLTQLEPNNLRPYKTYFITSRPETAGMTCDEQSAIWLRRHFFIANPTVIVSSMKGPLVMALGVKAFLDDKPENCLNVRAYSPFTKVFILTQPYNVNFDQPSVTRVATVAEFFERIKGA